MLPEALSGPRDRPIRSSMMYLTVDPFLSVCVERRQYYVGTSAEDRPEIQGYRTITRHSPEGYIVANQVWANPLANAGSAGRLRTCKPHRLVGDGLLAITILA